MNKIFLTIFIIITLLPASMVFAKNSASNDVLPYPTGIPSKITPFNVSTVLRWTPYMIQNPFNPLSNRLTTQGPFRPLGGEKLPVYATLLPMTPNETRLGYSIKILSLEGPSNISLNFKVNLVNVMQSSNLTTAEENPVENSTVINTAENNSASGSINLDVSKITQSGGGITVNPYSYANVMQDVKTNWAYSTISLQPQSNNKSVPWNHSLVVEISLSGFEDRTFFNYMRTQKGYSGWLNADFSPLEIPKTIYSDNSSESFYLGPVSQPSIETMSPSQLVYLSNESNFGSNVLQVKLQATASKEYKVHITVLRGLFLDKGGFATYSYSFITPIESNSTDLTVQIPWEKIQALNLTVTSTNKTQRLVNTTEGSFQTFAGTGNYYIVNGVEISFESVNGPWDMWATSHVQTTWLTNVSLADNTMNVTLNGKNTLMDYSNLIKAGKNTFVLGGTKSSLPGFTEPVLVLTLAIPVLIKKLSKKKVKKF